MIVQLDPTIPVDTPKGKGQAAFLIDYGPEQDLFWVTYLEGSREFWTFKNGEIRAQIDITVDRSSKDLGHGRLSAA